MFIKLKNSFPLFNMYGINHYLKKVSKSSKSNVNLFKQIRFYCKPVERQGRTDLKTFEHLVRQRREEARRSFVVQVFSEQSCWDLFEYCNAITPVKYMQHYSLNNNDHFVIAELVNDDMDEFLRICRHLDDLEALPVKSPFLWFKASQERKKKKTITRDAPFPSFAPLNESELSEMIASVGNVSEQMRVVFEGTRLDEVGTRLRFLTARQVELALSGMFPQCSVLPFGSSVNGFGKAGCDLDLGLRYASVTCKHADSRLVYQSKIGGQSGRPHIQRQMEMLADLLHIFLPGCSNVRRILKARVPIVKYTHDFTGLECDLSMTDLTGVYMSELLWLYGTMDSRVGPLVFTVRKWALTVGLTSPVPGKSITNFSITALVIFYLQTVNILPTYHQLVKLARTEDTRFAGDVNCTFVRDFSCIPETTNSTDPGTLLNNFFEYYSNFDYERFGVCIRSGVPVSKPDHSPLYLVNPLEPTLNVSRNVSPEEVSRLKVECRNASWVLQSSSSLVNLFKPVYLSPSQKAVSKTGKRMLTLKHLFKSRNFS